MDQSEDQSSAPENEKKWYSWPKARFQAFGRSDFSLKFLLIFLSVVSLLLLRANQAAILGIFRFMFDNLPLTLPVLTVALSIMIRPDELRTLKGWLNLSNYFALGLVTFSIWAFVAGQDVEQYIRINPAKVLDKNHSLLLVFGSFIWASFCSVVTALAEIASGSRQRMWRFLQVTLVAFSLSFLLAPFYLFEEKVEVERRIGRSLDVQNFMVSIPYQDPAYNQYLGRTMDPIMQCEVLRGVRARTPKDAIERARTTFLGSSESNQFDRTPEGGLAAKHKVTISDNLIVAAAEK